MSMKSIEPSIDALIQKLRTGIESMLGSDFVGLYLYGSVVYGDFTPGVSDIDLLAVSERFVTEADVGRLHAMHQRIVDRYPEWDDRIEVAYQSTHGLRTWRTERSPMGIISPGESIHLINAGHDWRINWFFVLDHGVTIAGPPPETLIDPIPREVFVDSARELGRDWQTRIHEVSDQREESYAILTTCRALYSHLTGKLVSKQAAARWVQEHYPEWTHLIDLALDRRISQDDNDHVVTLPETVRFIEAMVPLLDEPSSEHTGRD